MIRMLFTVFDSKAERFLEPFAANTVEEAIRQFRYLVNKPDHQFNLFPEDYTLFKIGEFDQESGECSGLRAPVSLGVAITLLSPAAPDINALRDAQPLRVEEAV